MVRQLIDRFFQGAIRLVMLTGVAFTVTACYGSPPERYYYSEPDPALPQQGKQMVQQLLNDDAPEAEQTATNE